MYVLVYSGLWDLLIYDASSLLEFVLPKGHQAYAQAMNLSEISALTNGMQHCILVFHNGSRDDMNTMIKQDRREWSAWT